jgi:hypothetical protein
VQVAATGQTTAFRALRSANLINLRLFRKTFPMEGQRRMARNIVDLSAPAVHDMFARALGKWWPPTFYNPSNAI